MSKSMLRRILTQNNKFIERIFEENNMLKECIRCDFICMIKDINGNITQVYCAKEEITGSKKCELRGSDGNKTE